MWNKWIYLLCLTIIALSVGSCSYASNETDILNDVVSDNVSSVDLKSDNYFNDSFSDVNSNMDNISIYYGERVNVEWESDEYCNCSVFIDNKLINLFQILTMEQH